MGQNELALWGQLDVEISKALGRKRIDWMNIYEGSQHTEAGQPHSVFLNPQVCEFLKSIFQVLGTNQHNEMEGMGKLAIAPLPPMRRTEMDMLEGWVYCCEKVWNAVWHLYLCAGGLKLWRLMDGLKTGDVLYSYNYLVLMCL